MLNSLLLLSAFALNAQEPAGSKDHPLIRRYEGSQIKRYSMREFDEYTLPLGKTDGTRHNPSRVVEGRVVRIEYVSPPDRSLVEVSRNYEAALAKGGFQTLFRCRGDECGRVGSDRVLVTAKLSRPEGDVYATFLFVYAGKSVYIGQDIVEIKPMQSGMVKVDASALAGDIARTGHSAVYGIYFDTAKWDVKSESAAALKEIATLLARNTQMKILVVGHTDSVGAMEANRVLSRKRAEAVVWELSGVYGVAPARLAADGAGASCPVASNRTEDGRALNRRVELVEQ
ncbi:MAG: OmpA family protein [Acidobacteria bacterium]|nr:OmpA family protein [Acidobacteriota bacterium]